MSIIAAVRKGRDLVVGSDSQSNFGSVKVPVENHRPAKILSVGDSFLATAGWGLYEDIFRDFLAKGRPPLLRTKQQIFAWFLRLWKRLHEVYPFVNDQSGKDDQSPFADLDASFLVVNKAGIFLVSSDLSISRFERYYAIGSGADFSLGALHALYEGPLGAEALARKAIDAAVAFSIYCGGAVEVRKVRLAP